MPRNPDWSIRLAVALIVFSSGSATSAPRQSGVVRTEAASPLPTWDDPTVGPEERARRALEAANTLDEQAQRSPSLAESRSRWFDAANLLDQFLVRNPSVVAAPSLRFQAAVYLWARARSMLDRVELLAPTNPDRLDASRSLDNVIARLRAILPAPGQPLDLMGQNVRFRLAQSLADRARLQPSGDPDRIAMEREAQGLLDRSINSPRLRAFARLLHAELANRLGQFGPAQIEAEEAEKLDPPPPLISTTEVRVTAVAGRGQFAEANQLIDRSAVSPEQKTLWKLRVVLAARKVATLGRDRSAFEPDAFRIASGLRDTDRPESRRGLMELARAIDEPGPDSPLEAWNLLAEGHLLLLEPDQAAKLALKGADRADANQPDQAASLRFKAGACSFEAEKYDEAAVILARIVDDAKVPSSLRARAGMLRALSLGRALAGRQPSSSKSAYLKALESQIRDFSTDPVSSEARWLLGKLRLSGNRRAEAIELWAGIAHGQPRWLEAQSNAAEFAIDEVEAQWVNRDSSTLRPRVDAARNLIRKALAQAEEGNETVILGLRLARLESIPGVGQPAEAVVILDRILRGPASNFQHRQARLARMVALAEQNRFSDAETTGRNEAKVDDVETILPPTRLLDRLASDTQSDLIRKRTGSLILVLINRWVDSIERIPEPYRDEVRLRQARGLLFQGDPLAARRAMARWGGPSSDEGGPEILRDLGDTYFRLEAYGLAVDVERLRSNKLASGTPDWFDARYSLALALYRSSRTKEARKIIDATTILHPDLGGGEIRAKFERLGQKIGADPG